MGIEDILMADESLFQDINAFDPDYVPQNFNYRDTKQKRIFLKRCLKNFHCSLTWY